MTSRIRNIQLKDLTIQRLGAGFARRVRAFPHGIAWKLNNRKGSSNINRLAAFKNKHAGERCFAIGNGPSLQKMNLQPLRDEFTFGSNRIYLLFDKLNFETTYYVSTNELIIDQCADEIQTIRAHKFINWRMRRKISQDEGTSFIYEVFRPHFSTNITRGFWGGATVTFAMMQIAYYMGFRQVILIGVDHSFKTKGTPHTIVTAEDTDINHFDSNYFSKGFRWQLPDLDTSEFAYSMAKRTYEDDGRQILDATVNGKLTVFPKVDYEQVLKQN